MKKKRININIDKEEHRQFKAKLASLGMSITEWILHQIKKFINQ